MLNALGLLCSARFARILKGGSDSRGRDNRSREARQLGDRRRAAPEDAREWVREGVAPPECGGFGVSRHGKILKK
jgi:hypothetical protein